MEKRSPEMTQLPNRGTSSVVIEEIMEEDAHNREDVLNICGVTEGSLSKHVVEL